MRSIIMILLLTGTVFGQGIVINEFLASNDACCTDEHADNDDFIELYNKGSASVDVGGMYLTDDLSEPTAYQIPTTAPDSTTVAPGEFLLLWADKEKEQGILHVEIKLSGDGEQIGLYASDGTTVVDTLTFGAQESDVSKGRNPDGSDTWETFSLPTPGRSNSGLNIEITPLLPLNYFLEQNYPNPFNPETVIQYAVPELTAISLIVYDLLGKEVKTLVSGLRHAGRHSVAWDGRDNFGKDVSGGIYLYRINSGTNTQVKKMLLVK